jgi:CRISPR-associated DxTHG motif protein
MKVICFLGTANYEPTTYLLDGDVFNTRFFPAAVAHFVQPEVVLICATATVRKHENLAALCHELGEQNISCQVVPIPEGHSEADLWAIFDTLTAVVEEGETVTFDVTHSFRSLPFLAFLAVAYLKVAKAVKVERVLYGAWEARDESNRSPVFDLTPFVSLLDWLTATSRFVETGDGYELASLLRAGMPSGPLMGRNRVARKLGHNLRQAAEAIDSISLALRLARPVEAMRSADHLEATLNQAMPGILERARPFGLLAEQVSGEYGQFAMGNPDDEGEQPEALQHQLTMIQWYINHRHVVQAAALAREWVISVLAHKFGAPMFDYEKGRKAVEKALNNGVRSRIPKNIQPGLYDGKFEALTQADEICKLWSKMSELRNDIAHVGMRINSQPAASLKRKVEELYPSLEQLAKELLS